MDGGVPAADGGGSAASRPGRSLGSTMQPAELDACEARTPPCQNRQNAKSPSAEPATVWRWDLYLRLLQDPLIVAGFCQRLGLAARLDGLDLAYTSDEGYWLQRSVKFGEAVLAREWSATARSGHPGVTVMWLGFLGIGPEQVRAYGGPLSIGAGNLEQAPGAEELMSDARLVVAVT